MHLKVHKEGYFIMKLMNAKQVAELFNVTEITVYGWVKSGILPSFTIGGVIRFDHDEIMEAARKGGKTK